MPNITNPTLALNVGGFSDSDPIKRTIDIFKCGRVWDDPDDTTGLLDADGWPTSMPAVGNFKVHWSGLGPAGTYVMTWEGEGTTTLSSQATSIVTTDHRKEFSYDGDGSLQLNITALGSPPIKNIKLFRKDHEALLTAGEVWNPDWLAIIQDARLLRFLDPMDANGDDANLGDWSYRPVQRMPSWTNSWRTDYAVGGLSVEAMVHLCNQTGCDGWFPLHHLCSDTYITNFATYVRDNLRAGLTAYYEYSNETWNVAFVQNAYVEAQGATLFTNTGWPTGSSTDKGNYYTGYRAAQFMGLVRAAYGEDSGAGAWQGVLATRGGVSSSQQRIDGVLRHIAVDSPPADTTIAKLFSVGGPSSYFGTVTASSGTERTELIEYLMSHTEAESYAWFRDQLLTEGYSSGIPEMLTSRGEVGALLATYGLELFAYEGGQHVHQSTTRGVNTVEEKAALDAWLPGFVQSSAMADLYTAWIDGWATIGEGAVMHFQDISEPSNYGSWGLLNSATSNPRSVVTLARNGDASDATALGLTGGDHYLPRKIGAPSNAGGIFDPNDARGGTFVAGSGPVVVRLESAPGDYVLSFEGGLRVLTPVGGEPVKISGPACIRYGS